METVCNGYDTFYYTLRFNYIQPACTAMCPRTR